MAKNLSSIAKIKKIKYFLISFVDLFGVLRSKLVPARAIDEMQKNTYVEANYVETISSSVNKLPSSLGGQSSRLS